MKNDMNIEFLNGTLRLRKYDSNNYIIEKLHQFEADRDFGKLKKGDKTEKWKTLGFYSKLEHVCNRIIEEGVLNSEATEVNSLKDLLVSIKNEISEKLLNKYE